MDQFCHPKEVIPLTCNAANYLVHRALLLGACTACRRRRCSVWLASIRSSTIKMDILSAQVRLPIIGLSRDAILAGDQGSPVLATGKRPPGRASQASLDHLPDHNPGLNMPFDHCWRPICRPFYDPAKALIPWQSIKDLPRPPSHVPPPSVACPSGRILTLTPQILLACLCPFCDLSRSSIVCTASHTSYVFVFFESAFCRPLC